MVLIYHSNAECLNILNINSISIVYLNALSITTACQNCAYDIYTMHMGVENVQSVMGKMWYSRLDVWACMVRPSPL